MQKRILGKSGLEVSAIGVPIDAKDVPDRVHSRKSRRSFTEHVNRGRGLLNGRLARAA